MRLLIADDHALVLDSLLAYFAPILDIDPVAAVDLQDAQNKILTQGPFDLVLLDLNMPGMDGLSGLERCLAMPAATRVALLTSSLSQSVALQALELGAAGFLPKSLPAKSLVNAIYLMVAGEQYCPTMLLQAEQTRNAHPLTKDLTARERQALQGLAEGKTNQQIAQDLQLSLPTVKLHVKTLYRKVGVSNRTQAALIARDAGVF